MSTRHAAVRGPYPFINPVSTDTVTISKGILDVYFIIQGEPTNVGLDPNVPQVHNIQLTAFTVGGIITEAVFTLTEGHRDWLLTFQIPNDLQGTIVGEVKDTGINDCRGVLVFDSGLTSSTIVGFAETIDVHLSRAEWHTEEVTKVDLFNITRCSSVEDADTLIQVIVPAGEIVKLENGYNTELSLGDDGELIIKAGRGLGKGLAPDLGNSDGCIPSPAVGNGEVAFISTINGLAPNEGNIALTTSKGLGITTPEQGKIRIIRKQ